MQEKHLEFNLRKYQDRLVQFEQRYGMSSQEFAVKFGAGELGDKAHWFEWQYVLEAQQGTQRQLELFLFAYPARCGRAPSDNPAGSTGQD